MAKSDEEIKPGDVRIRAEIRAVYGGSPQGGICPSDEKRCVNLFSDPSVGERTGYYDGWLAEEDELGPIFEYTGAGKSGNQTFDGSAGSGNRAILRHVEQGRVLRVFTQVGKLPQSDTKTHRYLGVFTLDEVQPYVWRRVHDESGNDRSVIVFRLRPQGPFQYSGEDMVPAAKATTLELAPLQPVTASMFQSEPATSEATPLPQERERRGGSTRRVPPHSDTSSTVVEAGELGNPLSLRAASAASLAIRREAELTQEYKEELEAAGHETGVFQIKVKGLTSTFRSDLYDSTEHVLYEVKGSSSRSNVWTALGKLLDYSHYVAAEDERGEPRRVILLPSAPTPDMYSLLDRYEVGVVYKSDDGRFVGDIG